MCEDDLTLPTLLTPRLLLGVASNLGTSRRTTDRQCREEARREADVESVLTEVGNRRGAL